VAEGQTTLDNRRATRLFRAALRGAYLMFQVQDSTSVAAPRFPVRMTASTAPRLRERQPWGGPG